MIGLKWPKPPDSRFEKQNMACLFRIIGKSYFFCFLAFQFCKVTLQPFFKAGDLAMGGDRKDFDNLEPRL